MKFVKSAVFLLCVFLVLNDPLAGALAPKPPNPQSGPVGVEGQINGPAPSQSASIGIPSNGQHFSNLPITVSGSCPKGLLVEIFDNNVFVGSANCTNGSYSIQVDLFDGQNDLIARVFDALNQRGPDSNTVSVFFSNSLGSNGSHPTLNTAYARRGADPGKVLSWPLALSGGTGPFAVSIDWGDNSPLDLISRNGPGAFDIQHTYTQSGIFKITVKAVDSTGSAAFLQLTGVSNGPIQQSTTSLNGTSGTKVVKVIVWWPLLLMFALILVAFWLGKKHQLETIRNRLRRGQRPI
jgi:hypothetical protein